MSRKVLAITAVMLTHALARLDRLKTDAIKPHQDFIGGYEVGPSDAQRAAERDETKRQLAKFTGADREALLTRELDYNSGHKFNSALHARVIASRRMVVDAGRKVRNAEKRAARTAIKKIEKRFTEAADKLAFGGDTPESIKSLFAELSAFKG
jgi:dsRNA-specific ribonuclease